MTKRNLIGTNLEIYHQSGILFNLDTILISSFVKIPKNTKTIVDYGTGNGVILLYLSTITKAKLIGIEIQEQKFKEAINNIRLNALEKQLSVLHSDIKDVKLSSKVDLIISNPPFFKVNNQTKRNIDQSSEIARHEIALTLEELIIKASKDIKHGGLLVMIHMPERTNEIITLLNKHKFSVKRIRFVHPYVDHSANHVLIEAKYGANCQSIIERPLILYKQKHLLSDEMQSIYEGRYFKCN